MKKKKKLTNPQKKTKLKKLKNKLKKKFFF